MSPIVNYTEIINYIKQLLSLATGKMLSSGIQHFYLGKKKFTLIQNNFASSNCIKPIIPIFELPKLLGVGLKSLSTWDIDKFKDLRTILEFLSSTDNGWVDDRVLSLIQCYEIIVHKWLKKKTLPEELKVLKQRLKPILKEWREDYPDFDQNGFWSGRINDSIKWGSTISLLENVLFESGLDNKVLKVNFNKLVNSRHSVAHTGSIGNINILDDLINGQFSLRLCILKMIGYDGQVIDYRVDSKKRQSITDYDLAKK